MFICPLSLKILAMLQNTQTIAAGSRPRRLSDAASGSLCCRAPTAAQEPRWSEMNPLARILLQDFFHLKAQSKQQGCRAAMWQC